MQKGYISCVGCGRMYKKSRRIEMEEFENHDCAEQDYDDTQDQILDQQFLHDIESGEY